MTRVMKNGSTMVDLLMQRFIQISWVLIEYLDEREQTRRSWLEQRVYPLDLHGIEEITGYLGTLLHRYTI